MGSPAKSFVDTHPEIVLEMKRLLMDYFKTIRQSVHDLDSRPSHPPPNDIEVKITKEGYPVLPNSLELDNLNKTSLIIILRTYLNAHYSEYSN